MCLFIDPYNSASNTRPYTPIVSSGELLFISGHIGVDAKTDKLVEGGIIEETSQTLKNIRTTLELAGYKSAQILKTTVFLRRIEDFKNMNAAYSSFFGGEFPARSTVSVKALPHSEALVEIDAIAIITK